MRKDSGVADAVVDNDISGELLVELTEAEIKEIAPKIGDRVRLRKLISQFPHFTCMVKAFYCIDH